MLGHVAEAPSTHIRSEIVTQGEGYRLVRVTIPEGEGFPCHLSPDVAIIVLRGEGRISVGKRDIAAEPGVIVPCTPGEQHAVYADQEMEIVFVQV